MNYKPYACCCFVKGHQTRAGASFQQEKRRKAQHGAGALNYKPYACCCFVKGRQTRAGAAFRWKELGEREETRKTTRGHEKANPHGKCYENTKQEEREKAQHGAGASSYKPNACCCCFVKGHQTRAGAGFQQEKQRKAQHGARASNYKPYACYACCFVKGHQTRAGAAFQQE